MGPSADGGPTVEPAEPDDAARLKRTLHAAFAAASVEDFGIEGVLPPGVDDGTMIETALAEQTVYAIRDGGGVVGGIIVEPRADGEWFLQTLWIDPDHQRSGLGSEAMAFLESAHPEASSWTLETPAASGRNRAFYEGHGFEVVDRQGDEGEVVLLTYRKELE